MTLLALKDLPTHLIGDVFEEPEHVGRILIAVGGARILTDEERIPAKRRTYRRRDQQADA